MRMELQRNLVGKINLIKKKILVGNLIIKKGEVALENLVVSVLIGSVVGKLVDPIVKDSLEINERYPIYLSICEILCNHERIHETQIMVDWSRCNIHNLYVVDLC